MGTRVAGVAFQGGRIAVAATDTCAVGVSQRGPPPAEPPGQRAPAVDLVVFAVFDQLSCRARQRQLRDR